MTLVSYLAPHSNWAMEMGPEATPPSINNPNAGANSLRLNAPMCSPETQKPYYVLCRYQAASPIKASTS